MMPIKAKESSKIRIPLPEDKALSLLLKVKPTADMPRQGKQPKAKNPAK
jgi:hypothetical protein